MFAKFFIDHPRFAAVISIVMALAGVISIFNLPVEQYPNVTPPEVSVRATYTGANAETIAKTVAAPLEENVNGTDGMIYMSSTSSNNGSYDLTVTFEVGTDPDMALVKVQNRISQIESRLPTEVTATGITVEKSNSSTMGFISLTSPNGTYDETALTNYMDANIKPIIQRVPGMGTVTVYGSRYSIRVWLDSERMAALGLGVSDVSNAISTQNKQASIGTMGNAPAPNSQVLTYTLTAQGRLSTAKEFEEIVVRSSGSAMVKLKDIARIELGAERYAFGTQYSRKPAAVTALSQSSGSNAMTVMRATKKTVAEIQKQLPEDMELTVGYDSTDFVKETIKEIVQTLFLTFFLVVLVCYLFLQDWRVTLVPVMAIPVSLLATFAGLKALNYTINILSLFGIVLVIGTVVDDAIVVVERVTYLMERDHCDAKTATLQAMKDITGPMVATTLVFLAIFVPVTFMAGITGQIFRQFAVTISISVMCSLVFALTMSPAICAHLLKERAKIKSGPFGFFNKALQFSTIWFVQKSAWIAVRKFIVVVVVGAACAGLFFTLKTSPTEFLPDEDQGAVFVSVQMPEGSPKQRTIDVIDPMVDEILALPGVESSIRIVGFNIMGGQGESVATVIVPLDPWGTRKTPDKELDAIVEKTREISSRYPGAEINVIKPPAINGLGTASGVDLKLESTVVDDPNELARVMGDFIGKLNQRPEVAYAFSTYTANTPHIHVNIDKDKAQMMNVPLGNIYDAMQMYFGAQYINDINIGTHVNRVMVQADSKYRSRLDQIDKIYVTSSAGIQIPLGTFITTEKVLIPRSISRYNLYPTAGITVVMNQGYSTGQGMNVIAELSKALPEGYNYEYSGMTYQEQQAGGGGIVAVLGISLLFAFLFLVAQYESFNVPISVIFSLPIAALGAILGCRAMGLSVSIYVQLGILILIGLAAKNAILIIEFARESREQRGLSIPAAASRAARERFRSVLMTAFTCVLGVLPMLFASGAGAGSRKAVGSTMFYGMTTATVIGIFFIPALYVLFESMREGVSPRLKRQFDSMNPFRSSSDKEA